MRILHQISSDTPAYLIGSCSSLGLLEGSARAADPAERRGVPPPHAPRGARRNPRTATCALAIDIDATSMRQTTLVSAFLPTDRGKTREDAGRCGKMREDAGRSETPKNVAERPKIVTAQLDVFFWSVFKKIWTPS
ncbi:hypothetical protein WME73_05565 [Sorangium sp. So ce302]|uniref:hypothetical protein n=1 Tax=Sorangium sp. So ce302 TaxID=3133297 RepID=UPI003F61478E